MKVFSFLIHQCGEHPLLWFSHLFEPQVEDSASSSNGGDGAINEEEEVGVVITDKKMDRKHKVEFIMKKTVEDWKQKISDGNIAPESQLFEIIFLSFLKYFIFNNFIKREGAFFIQNVACSKETLICLWKKFNASTIASITVTLECNRLLALHILQQIIITLDNFKDSREYMLRSEEVYAIIQALMPNGFPVFVGSADSFLKSLSTTVELN